MAQLEVREGFEMCVIGAHESRYGLDEEEEEAVSFWKHEGWYGHDGYWRTRGGGERSSECGYYYQSSGSTCVQDSSSSRLEAVVATQCDLYSIQKMRGWRLFAHPTQGCCLTRAVYWLENWPRSSLQLELCKW